MHPFGFEVSYREEESIIQELPDNQMIQMAAQARAGDMEARAGDMEAMGSPILGRFTGWAVR